MYVSPQTAWTKRTLLIPFAGGIVQTQTEHLHHFHLILGRQEAQ